MSLHDPDQYEFEVPTPKGKVTVLAPDNLTAKEARAAGWLIYRVMSIASAKNPRDPHQAKPSVEDPS